jgi:hypothetical protein
VSAARTMHCRQLALPNFHVRRRLNHAYAFRINGHDGRRR